MKNKNLETYLALKLVLRILKTNTNVRLYLISFIDLKCLANLDQKPLMA